MNLYDILKDTSIVIKDLFNFINNLLFYQIDLFGSNFKIIELIGYLAGVGLAIYVTIMIINLFS